MVIIFGPGAVGKMTVGMELSKLTGYPLLHNHITIEFLLKFFPHGTKSFSRLDTVFGQKLIAELAKSDKPGMIFTLVWALNEEADLKYVDALWARFTDDLANVCFVELESDQATRLERNKTEMRLAEKPSKADLKWSDNNLKEMDESYVLNSSEELPFFYPDRHLKIDNSRLEPAEVANKIRNHFKL